MMALGWEGGVRQNRRDGPGTCDQSCEVQGTKRLAGPILTAL